MNGGPDPPFREKLLELDVWVTPRILNARILILQLHFMNDGDDALAEDEMQLQ